MKNFGLVGFPLSHSFSKKYFTEKFQSLGISDDHQYNLYEIEDIVELKNIVKNTEGLRGLNVTIPYKVAVKHFLNEIDSALRFVQKEIMEKGLNIEKYHHLIYWLIN